MKILNLTQHPSTQDQNNQGVFDLADTAHLKSLLTFDSLPTSNELLECAKAIANIASEQKVEFAMIGGAGYLMPYLELALLENKIKPLHAFSKRDAVEKVNDDGSVSKQIVFKHVGFIGLD